MWPGVLHISCTLDGVLILVNILCAFVLHTDEMISRNLIFYVLYSVKMSVFYVQFYLIPYSSLFLFLYFLFFICCCYK